MLKKMMAFFGIVASSSSFALTPENGFWWNPQEPNASRGYNIEVQNNSLFFAGYLYQANGAPIWYSSFGTLVVDNTNDTGLFQGTLDSYINGPCITCTNRPAARQPGSGGNIRIDFFSETRARITWAGGSFDIERFDFGVTPTGGSPRTDSMLGQWQMMIDFTGATTGYPYYGDTLVINATSSDATERYFNGCRVTNTGVRTCTAADISANGLSGFHFNETQAGVTKDRLLIAVRDDSTRFLIYYLDYGTYQVNGIAKQCAASIPVDQRFSQCIRNSAVRALPVRGLRSMSRAFLQGNDSAPKAAPGSRAALALPNFQGVAIDPPTDSDLDWNDIPESAFNQLMLKLE